MCQTLEDILTQSKNALQEGVVAEPHEIRELLHYRDSRRLRRKFAKPSSGSYRRLFSATPYRFLRNQLRATLGLRAVERLDRAWKEHTLSLAERAPEKLRPCLLRVFWELSQAPELQGFRTHIKTCLRAFEGNFFPLVSQTAVNEKERFILLAQLQRGLTDEVLLELQSHDGKNPSQKLAQEPDSALKRLEFEVACRHRNWKQACRSLRLLEASREVISLKNLVRIYEGLDQEDVDSDEKLLVLKMLVAHPALTLQKRRDYAAKAWSLTRTDNPAPELGAMILKLFQPAHSCWSQAFLRIYLGSPVPHRWTRDFHCLGQKSSRLRRKCRTLLDMLRYPKERVLNRFSGAEEMIRFRGLALESLREVQETALACARLYQPRACPVRPADEVNLVSSVEETLTAVCADLGLPEPVGVQRSQSVDCVEIQMANGGLRLLVGSDFLAFDSSEQSFLIARALYRKVSGLAELEAAHQELVSSRDFLARALAYTEWRCYELDLSWSFDTVGTLRQICRATKDHYLERLIQAALLGGWCPMEERLADRFALSYSDVVSASHALVRVALGRHSGQISLEEGLAPLTCSGELLSVLSLRLQRLWCSFLHIG